MTGDDSQATPNARLQAAVADHIAGRFAEAERAYRDVMRRFGEAAPVLDNLGLAVQQQGRFDEAVACFRRAVEIDPGFANAWTNLGSTLRLLGRLEESVEACRHAVENAPESAIAFNNLGVALQLTGRLDEAAAACTRALELDPNLAEAAGNLGVALKELGRYGEAEAAHRRSVALKPESPDAWYNLGGTLQLAGRSVDAIAAYERVLALNPRHVATLYNLGFLLKDIGRLGEAIALHRQAIEIDPGYALAREQLLFELRHACDWRDLGALDAAANRALAGGKSVAPPFILTVRCTDMALLLRNAVAWSAGQFRGVVPFQHEPAVPLSDRQPLTVGYLSADFHDHATAHLLGPLFKLHDRTRFRIHAYSYGPDDGSAWRRRLIEDSDAFVHLEALDDEAAARRIREDGVDILVDLKGWTQGSRLGICARRPALVQATYLGFPGTSGAAFLDYAIVDSIVAPPGEDNGFSEKLVRMPHSYQVNDSDPPAAREALSRHDVGLPETGVVFASFNQPYKVEAPVFAVWMNVLKRVPEAVLWQLQGHELAAENLRRAAAAQGVDPARLIFAPMWPKDRHLARLRLADIALDTRTYCGHTSTSDALSVGLPVVAMRGVHFASRVSESCLRAIGAAELVTADPAAYEELAVRLAGDPAALAALKAKLAANRRTHPLFDTRRFARALERAYEEMWRIRCAGEVPRAITIGDMSA